MQSVLICIQTGKTLADPDKMEFETDERAISEWKCITYSLLLRMLAKTL